MNATIESNGIRTVHQRRAVVLSRCRPSGGPFPEQLSPQYRHNAREAIAKLGGRLISEDPEPERGCRSGGVSEGVLRVLQEWTRYGRGREGEKRRKGRVLSVQALS